VDLPPGTGDVQLSLCQMMPLTGAAVVSTPQDVALKVAEKAIFMFNKLRTPVLGVIENMSGFTCSHCGTHEEIFGSGGARRYAEERNLPFLGAIPLAMEIRTTADAGNPIVEAAPDSPGAKAFVAVAKNLAAQVSIASHMVPPEGKPEPAEVTRPAPGTLAIRWSDGHQSTYSARGLRLGCRCAQCVEEMTGRALLRPDAVPIFLDLRDVQPTGRYALHLAFSDGHQTGIYPFDVLRALCECGECRARAAARAGQTPTATRKP
jgi:ATP-binding protein involved in chromosome partitioning